MTDFVRRLVSGNKARFKDENLDLELDLVYVTDQVIIMGYPASGMEGLYRNRREDAKRFLEHRHGKNFWVFNFCPIRENAYDAQVFDGRVSRYPFPDHHAPPLAILPLVAREMKLWLDESKDHVAVLHCKAGKGRSGTLACSYLLSMKTDPTAPQLERSLSPKEYAQREADNAMDSIPPDDAEKSTEEQTVLAEQGLTTSPTELSRTSSSETNQINPSGSLKTVLDLHTSRRMKTFSSGKKMKQGVSIPSQRRWLYYWSLLLAGQAPPQFWSLPSANTTMVERYTKVRLTRLTVRIRETSNLKMGLVRAANTLIEHAGKSKTHTPTGSGSKTPEVQEGLLKGQQMWASIARYNDELVEELETWEKRTRHSHKEGIKGQTMSVGDKQQLEKMFMGGKWDEKKMVRSFARMSAREIAVDAESEQIQHGDKKGKLHKYVYHPVTDAKWSDIRTLISTEHPPRVSSKLGNDLALAGAAESSTTLSSIPNEDLAAGPAPVDTTPSTPPQGILVDANRELRIKLYMGQIFLTWMWLIPAFHLSTSESKTTLVLSLSGDNKDLDFALGVGEGIIDVAIDLEWDQTPTSNGQLRQDVEPLPKSEESSLDVGKAGEVSKVSAAVEAVAGGRVGDLVETKQAVEE